MVLAQPSGQLLVQLTNLVLNANKLSQPGLATLAPFLSILGFLDTRLKAICSVAVLEENFHVLLAPLGNKA